MVPRNSMLDHIRQSNLIENIDDPTEDRQSLSAWHYLRGQKELSHNVICKVQKIITSNQDNLAPHQKGYYRSMAKTNVWIAGHAAPPWFVVDELMESWIKKATSGKLNPKEAHIRFEKIHPFADGNGRTGRMLMWWMEEMAGDEPTLITLEDRPSYYRWFGGKS